MRFEYNFSIKKYCGTSTNSVHRLRADQAIKKKKKNEYFMRTLAYVIQSRYYFFIIVSMYRGVVYVCRMTKFVRENGIFSGIYYFYYRMPDVLIAPFAVRSTIRTTILFHETLLAFSRKTVWKLTSHVRERESRGEKIKNTSVQQDFPRPSY